AQLESSVKEQLTRRLDRSRGEIEAFMRENRHDLEARERNRDIKQQVDRRREHRLEVDDQLAMLANDFNKLMRERRFAEAELVARKAEELDPDNAFSQLLVWKAQ